MGSKEKSSGVGSLVGFAKAMLVGLVVGYSLALFLSRSVWFEMRVNTGHAIPAVMACFVLFFALRKRSVPLGWFLFLELAALLLLFAGFGFNVSAIVTVPAALLRDGFHLPSVSLNRIGLVLACLLGATNTVWVGAKAMDLLRGGTGGTRRGVVFERGNYNTIEEED